MLPLSTKNLSIRLLTLHDAPFMLALLNDADYIAHIADRGVKTLDAARRYLTEGALSSYQQYGYGLFMVEERQTGLAAGLCGLLRRPYLDVPDIGYAFMPAFRGKGYAFEAAQAVKNWGHQYLGLPEIAGICNADNQASIAILQRLGLRYRKDILLPDSQKSVCLFS